MNFIRFFAACAWMLVAAGISTRANEKKRPEVNVANPISRAVADTAKFTGRLSTKEEITVVPLVTGLIEKIAFVEGSIVKKGELLFTIEAKPHKARVAAAEPKVAQMEAGFRYASEVLTQIKELARKQAVSEAEVKLRHSQMDQAAAAVALAKADLALANLQLEATKIHAPIEGRIGLSFKTPGNLVKENETSLTTIVSNGPLHVFFDMEENTYLRFRKNQKESEIPLNAELELRLPFEEGYPHRARIDFVDSKINAKTGTIRLRAVVPNAKDLMMPGAFVALRLAIGPPQETLLIVDSAVQTKGDKDFVYVVDNDNKIEVRFVTRGPLQDDALRAISNGLKKGDWVVVHGLNHIRPNISVVPKRVKMSQN